MDVKCFEKMPRYVIPYATATTTFVRWALNYNGDLEKHGTSFFLYIDDTTDLNEPLKSAIEQIDQGIDEVYVSYNLQKHQRWWRIKPYHM
jgi:hypothetical protein